MGYISTLNVQEFREGLEQYMNKIAKEAQDRSANDASNTSWSYTIRDTAIVHTLAAVITALDNATYHSYEEDI